MVNLRGSHDAKSRRRKPRMRGLRDQRSMMRRQIERERKAIKALSNSAVTPKRRRR
jgi:hypothetical protein